MARQFACSPFLFLRPRQHGATAVELISNNAFESLSPTGARLVHFAVTPRTVADAKAAGFTADELEAGFGADLILWTDDDRYRSAKVWESANWSRAAYSIFSQFDLTYTENAWAAATLEQNVDGRRKQIETYLREEPYPEMLLMESKSPPVALPQPTQAQLRLAWGPLFARRSVRSFSTRPLTCNEMAVVLFGATINVRLAETSKIGGDAFFLLNSFYTWLDVFVAVQEVETIANGLYQYDPIGHSLRSLGTKASDREIAATIANQNWIRGGGFCLFVAVDWLRYMWVYRHARAYLNLLIQIGEFGQEVIQYASSLGLGGWMTPAVDETAAGRMFGIDQNRFDIMYFMKIGAPAVEPDAPKPS